VENAFSGATGPVTDTDGTSRLSSISNPRLAFPIALDFLVGWRNGSLRAAEENRARIQDFSERANMEWFLFYRTAVDGI
jgi:hypothetical protein